MTDFNTGAVHQHIQGQFGQKGHLWRTSADAATSADDIYYCIVATEASVVDYTDNKTGTAYTNKSIPAGFAIYGELEQINVDSGTVIIYKGDFINSL